MFFLFTGNFRGYGFLGSANFIPDSSPVKPKNSIPFHPKKKLPISQPSSKIRDHDFYALTRLNPPQKSSWKKKLLPFPAWNGFPQLTLHSFTDFVMGS